MFVAIQKLTCKSPDSDKNRRVNHYLSNRTGMIYRRRIRTAHLP